MDLPAGLVEPRRARNINIREMSKVGHCSGELKCGHADPAGDLHFELTKQVNAYPHDRQVNSGASGRMIPVGGSNQSTNAEKFTTLQGTVGVKFNESNSGNSPCPRTNRNLVGVGVACLWHGMGLVLRLVA